MIVRLERTIRAAPHAVYRAWLDPEVVPRWLAPGDLTVTLVEIDERPGGRYRIRQADAGRDVGQRGQGQRRRQAMTAVDEQHLHVVAGLQPAQGLGHRRLGDRQLVVGLRVHEVRVGPVRVEELHLAALGVDLPELLAGPEGPVDHGPVRGPPQPRAHERPALAGLDVLELEDLEDGAVHLDVVAVLELVGRDHGR